MKYNEKNNFIKFNNTTEILDKLKQLEINEDSIDFENLKKDLYKYSTFNIEQLFNTLALLESILIKDEYEYYKKNVLLTIQERNSVYTNEWSRWLDKSFPAHIIMAKDSRGVKLRYKDFSENIHLNSNAFDICKFNFLKNAFYGYNLRAVLFEPNEIFVDDLNINEATLLNFNFDELSFDYVDDFSTCVAWNFDTKSKYIFTFITELIRYRYNNRIDELKDIDLLLFTKEFLLNNFELIQKDCDNKITLDEVQQNFQKKLIYKLD